VFGIIYADSPLSTIGFSEDHLKVLTTLASVAAIRVENARLTEEQIERERLEREQQVASEIQQRFCRLPRRRLMATNFKASVSPVTKSAVTITTLLSAMTESSSWRSAMFPAKELLPRC